VVPATDPLPCPATLEDGRLDEIAARYGVTIATVRHWTNGRDRRRTSTAAGWLPRSTRRRSWPSQ